MTTTQKPNSTLYTNAYIGIGTAPWQAGVCLYALHAEASGLQPAPSCPMLLLETNKASLSYSVSVPTRPGTSPISVQATSSCAHIIPGRTAQEQIQACTASRFTRYLAERLKTLPPICTDDGSGAAPIRAYVAALMDNDIPRLLEEFLVGLRDIRKIQSSALHGQFLAVEQKIRIIIAINGGGATGNGLANYVALLLQNSAQHHRLPIELVLIVMDPSSSVVAGGANNTARVNFIMAFRHSLALVQHWDSPKVALPTFYGLVAPTNPLWSRIYLVGSTNGRVTNLNRSSLTATLALTIRNLLGAYGSFADGNFQDGNMDVPVGGGPAVMARIGIWRATAPPGRALDLAVASGIKIAAAAMAAEEPARQE